MPPPLISATAQESRFTKFFFWGGGGCDPIWHWMQKLVSSWIFFSHKELYQGVQGFFGDPDLPISFVSPAPLWTPRPGMMYPLLQRFQSKTGCRQYTGGEPK